MPETVTRATGHEHPHLRAGLRNYSDLLERAGRSPDQVRADLAEVTRPFGIQVGA